MRKTVLIVVLSILFVLSFADEWDFSGDIALILNQNAYSNNWVGNDKGSISWSLNSSFSAVKQLNEKIHNSNSLKLAFGQTYTQTINEDGDKRWGRPDKNTDKIDLETLFRLTLGFYVDPFVSFRWESQFMDKEEETKYLNPNILTEAIGVSRMFLNAENTELSTRFGAAFKQYLNRFEDKNTHDGGLELIGIFKNSLKEKIFNYKSKLVLYQALFFSEADEVKGTDFESDWKALRMNWEHTFTADITKLLSLNLYFELLYDKTVLDELRFKQTLGMGLSYKLF